MKTLTSRNKYWPLLLLPLAIIGLLFLATALIFHGSLVTAGFFLAALVVGLLLRKIVRSVTFDGRQYTLTYMQWGRLHTDTLDAANVLVSVVSSDMGRNVWKQYLKITDLNHRLLYEVRTGDGYNIEDLKAFAS
ncbi:MAG TPA: hypothetical protein VL547_03880 [Dinghuibacter sp.]|jgi:hypothetical protein|uniref:hypothetical protein n=1 Tax=Dinghuibacter sp. TaxID=2024697 RepID=UPI002C30CBF8|nr:hypothetical protein [Dinghuibacter sp.]HTJ11131.1 hypothetical protein [Dinghuibacter sp.]